MTNKRRRGTLRKVIGRALLPHHMWRWLRIRRNHERTATKFANAQLQLYNRILPGDFLHYGYFDDPDVKPEDMSFNRIYEAQLRYAEKMVALIPDGADPVLDVGCGMGVSLAA